MNITKVKNIDNLEIGDVVLYKESVHSKPINVTIKQIHKIDLCLYIKTVENQTLSFPIKDQINNLKFMKSIKNIDYGFSIHIL